MPSTLPMLRKPDKASVARHLTPSPPGFDVRPRLGALVDSFMAVGKQVCHIRSCMEAFLDATTLSAPFYSIVDLRFDNRKVVFDAVANTRSRAAFAALLALSAVTDGEIEALSGVAAARLGWRFRKPPWVQYARLPVKTVEVDPLVDMDDPDIHGMLFTVEQANLSAAFFMRFYRDSYITEKIIYFSNRKRDTELTNLAGGTKHYHPHRYTRSNSPAVHPVDLIDKIIAENEENLWLGFGVPSYPYRLHDLDHFLNVPIVPAQLVLLRKFVYSAFNLAKRPPATSYEWPWIPVARPESTWSWR